MHATPLRTPPSRSPHRAAAALVALGAFGALGTVCAAAEAAVYADVVSATPVTAFVPVQRRDCTGGDRRSTDPSVVDGDSEPLGASDGTARCRTVVVRTQRVVGWDVVYELGGQRQTVRLDRDPGSRVELGVVAQSAAPAGRPVGRMIGRPVERGAERATERPVGQPVPEVVDDGGPVAAPTYGYGEQAPIGAVPRQSTTVIVERPYGYGGYGGWGGWGYGASGYYDSYPYGYGYGYGYPGWAFGPTIGIGFWGGGWSGHRGGGHWDRGGRGGPPKTMFPHGGGNGGRNARR